MPDTKQTALIRDSKGRIIGGTPPAGFNVHPENRSDGGWSKEGSISYQYQKLMRMSTEELTSFKPETVAQDIALARIRAARDSRLGLSDAKEITDRTEGKAPQSIDVTSGGETIKTTLVEFVGLDGRNSGKNNNTNTG